MSEINCGNCKSACCLKGTEMVLSAAEVSKMISGGTELRITNDRSKRTGLFAEYVLLSDCGFLSPEGLCTVYDDPGRPRICSEFADGSDGCIEVRLARGVEKPLFNIVGEYAVLADAVCS